MKRKGNIRPSIYLLPLAVLIITGFLLLPGVFSSRAQSEQSAQKQDRSSSSADGKVSIVEVDGSSLTALPISSGKAPRGAIAMPLALATADAGEEVEPNGTSATATPLGGTDVRIRGNIFPNGDIDFYSFAATAGDRVYAATMTSFSASASVDSVLDIIAADGTTVLETDLDDGSFGATSSSIAGFTIPATGTFFLRVRHQLATGQLRPYELYVRLQSGSPTPETEPNDTFPGQALPASGWVSGSTSATTDLDFYAINLNAGDTVYLSLDLDPERDTTEWNAQLGLGAFGTPPLVLVVNDAGTATPDSEAFFMTVKAAGTYGIFVGVPTGGTTTGTYNLSVSVLPQTNQGINCTTFTSTNVPVAIPTGPGIATSTLTVPGNPTIESIRIAINLTHDFMADLDVELTSPTGNTIGLFSDIGSVTVGAQTTMDITLDESAGIPIGLFTVVQGMNFKPELNFRLSWLKGQPAGGTWTLTMRDDAAGDGGTLNSWSIEICEPSPICAGGTPTPIFSTDFESGAAGFTHTGTQDEWELGNPTFAPVTGCNSGVNCWKTDLDNTYNASSSQDLLSPNIDLTTFSGQTLFLNWAQKFQMESATFDHAFVEVREVGNPTNARRVWEFLDATMTNTVGNPAVTVQEAAGWGLYSADISDFGGLNIEVRFHLDSDTTVQLAGLAIDDVAVVTCASGCTLTCPANVTVSNDPNQCGAVVTYPPPTTSGGCTTVTCSPPSGSFFPVGTTTVTCTDAGGASCPFTVTVVDTQPPSITCPADVTATPPTAGGTTVVVTFDDPLASDNCPGVTTVCVPPSGSSFAVGASTVTCTATDAAGNTATCSFAVTVFNFAISDPTNPTAQLLVDSAGNYVFCCGTTTICGQGTVKRKGNILTIEHNTTTFRVLIKIDISSGKADATLKLPPGQVLCQIIDRAMNDTAVGTCTASSCNPTPQAGVKSKKSKAAGR